MSRLLIARGVNLHHNSYLTLGFTVVQQCFNRGVCLRRRPADLLQLGNESAEQPVPDLHCEEQRQMDGQKLLGEVSLRVSSQ